MKQLTLENVFSGVSVVLGRTGGKGVYISSYESGLSAKGVKLIKLSSGDCFRAASKTNKALAERMATGKLIEDHDDIREPLKGKIREYLTAITEGQNVELVLDGFERLGAGYVYKEKSGKVGQKAESQVSQIARAFEEVLVEMGTKNPELVSRDLLRTLMNGEAYPIFNGEAFNSIPAEGLILDAYSKVRRYYINTTAKDSESFQRGRSVGALSGAIDIFKNIPNDATKEVVTKLENMKALQEGRFEIKYVKDAETGKKKQSIRIALDKKPRTISHCMDGVSSKAYDDAMITELSELRKTLDSVNKGEATKPEGVLIGLGDSLSEAARNMGVFDSTNSVPSKMGAVRADDLTMASRKQREQFVAEETISMMVNELGYELVDKKNDIWRREGIGECVLNGPDREIGLKAFEVGAIIEGARMGEASRYRNQETLRVSVERV